jgi:hypothetical protein
MGVCVAFIACLLLAQPSRSQHAQLQTVWAKGAWNGAPTEYPRPQMVRPQWECLNGHWDYAITAAESPMPTTFDGKILVPYPVESYLSGVQKPLLPTQRLWYRREITRPAVKNGDRILLNFGAVDYQASVFINGKQVGEHTGGYQSFSIDITDALKDGKNDLLLRVFDPTDKGPNPHGKQVLKPEGILYTASSGIWQTAWLETVPAVSIKSIKLTPDVDAGVLHVAVQTNNSADGYDVAAVVKTGQTNVATAEGKAGVPFNVSVPQAHLWSTTDPFLYDLTVELRKNGKVVDSVGSYFGMRKIEVKKDVRGIDRIFLNGAYLFNFGVLDQGFWPDGLHTAPTDAATHADIETIRAMGFNTIRKHIKIEPERWYYWCDKLGMLVWQDMPEPGADTPEARTEFEKESAANMEQLFNHPSIVIWVLFNEQWNSYDQARLAKWMKDTDPSRLVNGQTGPFSKKGEDLSPNWVNADMTDIHKYPGPGIPPAEPGKARVLGEFGGIGVIVSGHQWDDMNGWGYVKDTPAQMLTRYTALASELKKLQAQGLSGAIYTQPTDVEIEVNGLLTYDRKLSKLPLAKMREINLTIVPGRTQLPEVPAFLKDLPAADPNPEHEYQGLLAQHKQGDKDLAFLRRTALLAQSLKHEQDAEKIADEYMGQITGENRFTKANIQFFHEFTKSSHDKGFEIFSSQPDRVDQVMGKPGYAHELVAKIRAKEKANSGAEN